MKKYPPFVKDKRISSQGTIQTLVPGITSPSMPSNGINYTQSYSKATYELVSSSGGVAINGSLTTSSPSATATITIANADFFTGMTGENYSEIYIGEYRLIANTHFSVGTANVNLATGAIATNLAAAINNLREFTATPNGNDVEITCTHSVGSAVTFKSSERVAETCFTLSPTNGFMTAGVQFGSISVS